ncbi:UDP-N-acetylmuramoyl-L-alanyl-D-glutamate--2,6-diaminopimelate ligase [Lewinella marina]|uniref:UDP-N-acetylmuramoyl-L-alanyl-D-glutamate--2,6-diaminopimelate ligase n=1 Tax=Neolewinella marina TaxID=438751 RepID=A0A2G0CIX8_9BACT|nr:UDP-N-acetylmuramoyl-L-alanyl-D-glutamate--2,6-diaminopimelate ligase [Neolewinella marina]NJB84904.1 UDP-N-acetylmuramoyl-L-alanyl-D-glutamate--2,6-diaminopimelate ligase [Neolewinella marina]PHK99943.1 UDP-N-acetylmuramoyl-L-alanyl-D-glutamate--2,6-diaminopimelate ligase [Neolewinella marina]
MQLERLIAPLDVHSLSGEVAGRTVTGVAFDSRKVRAGFLFVAVRGTQVDGHDYVQQALDAGAGAVVAEPGRVTQEVLSAADAIGVFVPDTTVALAQLADNWYGSPSREMTLVGVTGTNGKTTVTTLLHELYTELGFRAGLLSTVEVRIGREKHPATHTTPDALAIHGHLAEMRDAGVDYVFMEVSSHAVHQRRTLGLDFNGGVFTNLSHDHLDYHGTFAEYINAKKAFFDQLPATAFALVNADDRRGGVMVQNTAARVHRYSLRSNVDFHARLLANTPQGLQLDLGGTEVFFKLLGRFNAYNLLAAYATAVLLGADPQEVLVTLSALPGAEGRLEHVHDPAGRITALVDYAHTPDALRNVLETLRALLPDGHRLSCVVGAGGDRDRSKRPEMARIAAELADQVILTTDNPRSESPEAILDEMEAGVPPAAAPRVLRITDRRQAIRTAVRLGHEVLLVAGKGHETYQEIRGERFSFDDRLELAHALKEFTRVN